MAEEVRYLNLYGRCTHCGSKVTWVWFEIKLSVSPSSDRTHYVLKINARSNASAAAGSGGTPYQWNADNIPMTVSYIEEIKNANGTITKQTHSIVFNISVEGYYKPGGGIYDLDGPWNEKIQSQAMHTGKVGKITFTNISVDPPIGGVTGSLKYVSHNGYVTGFIPDSSDPVLEIPTNNIPLIQPPVLGSIANSNPYTNPSDNQVKSGVSKSINSISLSWKLSSGDPPTRMWYRLNGGRWVEISTMYSCTITGLTAGTSYKVEIQGQNEAGNSNILTINVRTRNAPPVVALRVSSINLEQITFTWNSNKDLAKAFFSIDDGSFTEISGVSGKLGTFTAKWFNPNTEHTIRFYGISTAALDYLTSSTVSASGTTLDRSRIKPVTMQPFGCEITLAFTCKSSYPLKLKITVTGKESRSATFSYDNIQRTAENVSYTWRPTQAELDSIYRCYTDTNKVTMDFCLTTHGEWKDWDDTSNGHDLVLTGIAKTAHIGVNKVQKRGQCFISIDGEPKRAVTWIGINGVPKRGI